MNRLLPFAEFTSVNEDVFTRPEMYFNKEKQCLCIGEQLIFLQENELVNIKDERVTESFGDGLMGFLKNMVPETTSEWVHLGVDGIAALCSAGAFVTFGISELAAKWIEFIHGISYFIEARYKPQEQMKLCINGFITLAFSSIPLIGGLGAGILKLILGSGKWVVGKFFGKLLTLGVPSAGVNMLGKLVAKSSALMSSIGKRVAKLTQGTFGKLMLQLPIVGRIMKFFRNDLDLVLEKTGSHLTTDLAIYTRTVILNSEKAIAGTYKSLSKEARQILSQKQFVELNKAMIHTEMTGLPVSTGLAKLTSVEIDVARNFLARSGGATGRDAVQKAAAANVSIINQNLTKVTTEVAQIVEQGVAKDASLRGIKKTLIENATKKTVGADLVKHIKTTGGSDGLVVVMRKFTTGSKTIGEKILILLKQGLKTGVKSSITGAGVSGTSSDMSLPSFGGSDSEASTASGTSGVALPIDTAPSDDAAAKMSQDAAPGTADTNTRVEGDVKNTENVAELAKAFTEQNHLKIAVVESKEALGNLGVSFSTPKKDNTDGKLILSGDMLAQEFNVTETLHPYEKKENLLIDLKKVKGKDDKTTIRDGEYKKWERSNTFTTPFVTADTGRYVFHFLVRDRSIISLAKKNFDEKLVWAEMLTPGVLEKGYYKINSSLYILVKKVTDKGYDE